MKIYVACRETGDKIEKVESIEMGLRVIQQFEEYDKLDGIYEPDFYNLVDEKHNTISV